MLEVDLTEKHALRITWLGLFANLILAIAKGFIGTIAPTLTAPKSAYEHRISF